MAESFDTQNDTVSLDIADSFRELLRHWKTFCLWGLLAAVMGVAISFTAPKQYKVVTKVAPELSLRSSSLSSLASLAGINGMNMLSGNNDALLPTVYPEIVGSVPFITDLFGCEVKDTTTLYYYVLNDTRAPLLGTILSLPSRAAGAVVGLFKSDSDEVVGEVDNFHLTREQYAVYRAIKKSIMVDVDKRTFCVTITVTAQNPLVAANLSKKVIENLKKTVTAYRTDKAQNNVDYLKGVYKTAQEEYYLAQKRFADYSDSHQSMSWQGSQIERQRLQNEATLKFQLYSSVAQQLQQAEVVVQQEAPVFAEVVPPTIPLRKASPSRMKYLVGFLFLGVVAAFVKINRKEKIIDFKSLLCRDDSLDEF